MKESILISSCLTGCCVRYDGGSKPLSKDVLSLLKSQFNLVAVCPEMLGGLPCPRRPSEITSDSTVKTAEGQDVSLFFIKGAHSTLNICKNYRIRTAVLKSKSPSCGVGIIYDGSFTGRTIPGNGITAELLKQNGISILTEDQVNQLLATKKE